MLFNTAIVTVSSDEQTNLYIQTYRDYRMPSPLRFWLSRDTLRFLVVLIRPGGRGLKVPGAGTVGDNDVTVRVIGAALLFTAHTLVVTVVTVLSQACGDLNSDGAVRSSEMAEIVGEML